MTTRPARPSSIELSVSISRACDVILAQSKARSYAALLGFGRRDQWAIAIAVSEAATNILKFAGRGEIRFGRLEGDSPGIEFQAVDDGPGMAELERGLEDGFSEGRYIDPDDPSFRPRGMGSGLPAIKRLMDAIVVCNREEGGALIIGRKYLLAIP